MILLQGGGRLKPNFTRVYTNSHVEHNAHAFRTFTLGSTISIALCEVEGPPGKTSYSKSSRQRKDMLFSWLFGHLKIVTQED